MSRPERYAAFTALTCIAGVLFFRLLTHVPDLAPSDAARIIEQAPELNRYARLVKVNDLRHMPASLSSQTLGKFTFTFLEAAPGAKPIEANVDFRYIGGKWYLNGFSYGCPADCHFVHVLDGPELHRP
jgi:hypothetical protein